MKKSTGRMGRDDERARQEKAAPSHSTQTHKVESDRNKKENAGLHSKGKK